MTPFYKAHFLSKKREAKIKWDRKLKGNLNGWDFETKNRIFVLM
jgi:hypothetical protein